MICPNCRTPFFERSGKRGLRPRLVLGTLGMAMQMNKLLAELPLR